MEKKFIKSNVWTKFSKNKLGVLGLIIIIILFFMAIFAPLLATHDPVKQNLQFGELPIGSANHFLGTDNFGRDLWSRIVYGSRISLTVGVSSVLFGVFFGMFLGVLAGYYRALDGVIMRLIDIMFAFPGILLALLIIAVLGTSLLNMIIAISIWSVPACARIVRSEVLSIKKREYILALKAIGASDLRIIVFHMLPNCLSTIIVFATMRMATAILSASSLSFLGLGAQPPTPEWGAMVAAGREFIWTTPHLIIVPGVAIMLAVFAFNIVGDALRDALDPNLQENA